MATHSQSNASFNFAFALFDPTFADRTLRVILTGESETCPKGTSDTVGQSQPPKESSPSTPVQHGLAPTEPQESRATEAALLRAFSLDESGTQAQPVADDQRESPPDEHGQILRNAGAQCEEGTREETTGEGAENIPVSCPAGGLGPPSEQSSPPELGRSQDQGNVPTFEEEGYVANKDFSGQPLEEESPLQGDLPPRIRDLPVSSVILAAKSAFFRQLFSTSSLPLVVLEVPAADEPMLLELLSFIYSGVLPAAIQRCLASLARLLVVAHRFGAEECVAHCAQALRYYIPHLTPSQAVVLVELPEAVRCRPQLIPHLQAARAVILHHYTPLLRDPIRGGVVGLSEGAMLVLLQSDELAVESEDVVAKAALAWVRHRYATMEERMHALRRTVLPHLRLASLSPSLMETLQGLREFGAPDLQQQLFRALIAAARNPSSERDTLGGDAANVPHPFRPHDVNLAPADVSSLASQLQGFSLGVTDNRPCLRQGWGKEDTALPRSGCRPPCGHVTLTVLTRQCMKWTPCGTFLALSQATHVSGRHISLGAKLVRKHSDVTLGLYVLMSCHKEEEMACRFRFCARIADSNAPFSPLSKVSARVVFRKATPQWGYKDALGRPWKAFLQELRASSTRSFQLRAELWF